MRLSTRVLLTSALCSILPAESLAQGSTRESSGFDWDTPPAVEFDGGLADAAEMKVSSSHTERIVIGLVGGGAALLAYSRLRDSSSGVAAASITAGVIAGQLLAIREDEETKVFPMLAGAAGGGFILYLAARDVVVANPLTLVMLMLAPPLLGDLAYSFANSTN